MADRRDLLGAAEWLRSFLNSAVSDDELAYACLDKAGERQPWTELSRLIWAKPSADSEWKHHHLAIVHHSAAYDLEAAGSPNAFIHWKAALDLWSRLCYDEPFWDRMHHQLERAMGVPVDREVVEAARRKLRQDLLAPHVTLAGPSPPTDPARAAAHPQV